MTKTLDLGCGPYPKNPFEAKEVFGVDIVDFGNPNIKVADLVIDPIPFEDNYFDYVTGFDFLEHIPRIMYNGRERSQPFIEVMDEIHRVLKPGGEAYFHTPAYPHPETFQDPQHVNFITEYSVAYFIEPNEKVPSTAINLTRSYGFKGRFHLLGQGWHTEWKYHLIWHLKKIED